MKTITTLLAIFMAMTISAQNVEEVSLDLLTTYEAAAGDYYLEIQNEDYYLQLDLNEAPATGKTFTMANSANDEYNAVRCKDEIVTNRFNTKEWRKYFITDLSLVFTEVNAQNKIFKFTATVEAKSGDDVIKRKFTFDAPTVIGVKLDGTAKYEEDLGIYSFRANNGLDVKADYTLNLGIKSAAYKSGKLTTSSLSTYGNSIKVSGGDDTKIKTVDLTVTKQADDKVLITGTVTDANNVNYTISVTTNDPDKVATESYVIDFGNILQITTEEGSVKLIAENAEHRFIGYLNSPTTELPTGTYTLASDSKYGDYLSDFGFYMMDEFKESKMDVTNDGQGISIVVTFKQNGNNYTVTAATTSAGITTVTTSAVAARAFNLAGQRVSDNAKGIVIKGGKKMLMK